MELVFTCFTYNENLKIWEELHQVPLKVTARHVNTIKMESVISVLLVVRIMERLKDGGEVMKKPYGRVTDRSREERKTNEKSTKK